MCIRDRGSLRTWSGPTHARAEGPPPTGPEAATVGPRPRPRGEAGRGREARALPSGTGGRGGSEWPPYAGRG
eukprot:9178207-Alexandrium_andersonii.AAC.1